MSFLRVKKRVKFNVELVVVSLSDVPLLNAIIFAKVRLLECGSFGGFTWHRPVHGYKVDFMKSDTAVSISAIAAPNATLESTETASVDFEENPQPFKFQCRIPSDERTGELAECRCKISLRKEDRAGKSPQKLGFVILNLSEFAASGTTGIFHSFLLDGYTAGGQRQDNSRVNIYVKMVHQAQDPLFKVPKTTVSAMQEAQLNPADRKAPSANCENVSSMGLGPNIVNNFLNSCESAPRNTIQPREHHYHKFSFNYHHYDDRPVSCTNFNVTSSENLAEQRASWHADAALLPMGYSTSANNGDRNLIVSEANLRASSSASGIMIDGTRKKSDDRGSAVSLLSNQNNNLGGSTSGAVSSGLAPSNCSSLANRIQKTRRDVSGVIEEVFAETSALLANEATSNLALSWEGIGGENYDVDSHSNHEEDEFENTHFHHVIRQHRNNLGNNAIVSRNNENENADRNSGLYNEGRMKGAAHIKKISDNGKYSLDNVEILRSTKLKSSGPISARRAGETAFIALANGMSSSRE